MKKKLRRTRKNKIQFNNIEKKIQGQESDENCAIHGQCPLNFEKINLAHVRDAVMLLLLLRFCHCFYSGQSTVERSGTRQTTN